MLIGYHGLLVGYLGVKQWNATQKLGKKRGRGRGWERERERRGGRGSDGLRLKQPHRPRCLYTNLGLGQTPRTVFIEAVGDLPTAMTTDCVVFVEHFYRIECILQSC